MKDPAKCIYLDGEKICKLRAEEKRQLLEAAKHGRVYHCKYHCGGNEFCPLVIFPDLLAANLIDCKLKSVSQIKRGERAGLCSEERSMIAPQYAHNFICDFILNRPTNGTQLQLF